MVVHIMKHQYLACILVFFLYFYTETRVRFHFDGAFEPTWEPYCVMYLTIFCTYLHVTLPANAWNSYVINFNRSSILYTTILHILNPFTLILRWLVDRNLYQAFWCKHCFNIPLQVAPIHPHGQIQTHATISSVPPFLHGPQLLAKTQTTTSCIKKIFKILRKMIALNSCINNDAHSLLSKYFQFFANTLSCPRIANMLAINQSINQSISSLL